MSKPCLQKLWNSKTLQEKRIRKCLRSTDGSNHAQVNPSCHCPHILLPFLLTFVLVLINMAARNLCTVIISKYCQVVFLHHLAMSTVESPPGGVYLNLKLICFMKNTNKYEKHLALSRVESPQGIAMASGRA